MRAAILRTPGSPLSIEEVGLAAPAHGEVVARRPGRVGPRGRIAQAVV